MTGLIFHLIPHTHWDREWYLPRAALQARLVAVVDDLIERLHADPGYRSFLLDGQTVLLEDYLRARPDREGDVRALVKTGRLQVGPWYVLPDEQIPSGEGVGRAPRCTVLARCIRASARLADAGTRVRDPVRRRVARVGGRGRAGPGPVPLARARREGGRALAPATRGVRNRGRAARKRRAPVRRLGSGARPAGPTGDRETHPRVHRCRSSRRPPGRAAAPRPARGARPPERVPRIAARRILSSRRGRREAGAPRRRAALVVSLRVDAPGRARDARAAQAAVFRSRAGARASGRAARGAGAARGRARPAAGARARLACVGVLPVL